MNDGLFILSEPLRKEYGFLKEFHTQLLTIDGSARDIEFPTTDGTADQVMATDGAGTLSFADVDSLVDLSPYVKKDGSTPFTGTQGGITPVADADLSTKGYVDTEVAAIDLSPYLKIDGSNYMEAATRWYDGSGTQYGYIERDDTDNSLKAYNYGKKVGTSLEFDGSPDRAYLASPPTAVPTGTNARTMAFWCKASSWPYPYNHVVCYGDNSTNKSFGMYITVSGDIYFYGYGGGIDFDTGENADTNWHYHVITYDGTTVKYYIDNMVTEKASSNLTLATTNTNIYFGASQGNNREFHGDIDEVAIFDKALDSTERAELYNSGSGKYMNSGVSTYADVVSCWHFDEGSGTTVADAVGSNDLSTNSISDSNWVSGKVASETYALSDIWGATDAAVKGYDGEIYFGDEGSRTRVHGKDMYFAVGGTDKYFLNTSSVWVSLIGTGGTAWQYDTDVTFSSGKLLSLKNASSEKAYIDYAGLGYFLGGLSSDDDLDMNDNDILNVLTVNGCKAPGGDYVKCSDRKSSGSNGGTFTSGAWQTRTINTEDNDASGICSVLANQMTLQAGTYRCRISAPAHYVNQHQTILTNVTDGGTTVLVGTSSHSGNGAATSVASRSEMVGEFTITGAKALIVRHKCATTKTTNGFGVADGMNTEVYTVAEFWRVDT